MITFGYGNEIEQKLKIKINNRMHGLYIIHHKWIDPFGQISLQSEVH